MRLLFIDLLRIVGISLVVVHHLQYSGGLYYFAWAYFSLHWPAFHIDMGSIGIWLFIFASGSSLALKEYSFSSIGKIGSFYYRRLSKIYPIYWFAVLFCIFISTTVYTLTVTDLWRAFSGFEIFFVTDSSWYAVNGTFWFIGLIVCLYLLFPVVYTAIKKRPTASIIILFLIYLGAKYMALNYLSQFIGATDWFPLCHIFDFSLGIFLVQKGMFTKSAFRFMSNKLVTFGGELSFYIYLVHGSLLKFQLQFQMAVSYWYSLLGFFGLTILFSCVFYSFDKEIHSFRRKQSGGNGHVKN